MSEQKSYITLLSTEDYLIGVLALNISLRKVRARYPLLVMLSHGISELTERKLHKIGLQTIRIPNTIEIDSTINQEKGYTHWSNTFDKLYLWQLTDFDKLVFLDSDMMVCKNIDHLFDAPHMSAANADIVNEPDCTELNSGLMVVRPSKKEYEGLLSVLRNGYIKKLNYGDQDVIRYYYKDWSSQQELHLERSYNAFYSAAKNTKEFVWGGIRGSFYWNKETLAVFDTRYIQAN